MPPENPLDVSYRFGPYRLIPGRRLLLQGARPLKLGGRALDLLHLLVMRRAVRSASRI